MNEETRKRIAEHGGVLLRIFPRASEQDPVKLCRKLRRLESEARNNALALCNGDTGQEAYERKEDSVERRLKKLLEPGPAPWKVPVFINSDPRGSALKIDPKWAGKFNRLVHARYMEDRLRGRTAEPACLYTDFGGYGLIAPNLTKD